MVFSSSLFVFGFLPLVLLFYFIAPKKLKNYVLLLFSLIFYAWGEPKFVFVMIAVVAFDYISAILIEKSDGKRKKMLLFFSMSVNVLFLVFFKYLNFIVSNLSTLTGIQFDVPFITLPIGISFFTFQAMSYVIDVYRKDTPLQKNPFKVLLYISLFPQLIAGPILRYTTVEEQIDKREINVDKYLYGVERFILGLFKKVVIADNLALLADSIFGKEGVFLSTPVAWIGILAYTLQIFYDFSAYSDMAIGLGKIFGFDFPENFNYPYISKSITEFWRRWHISLSTWFRDYVYIPLGGNRVGLKRQILNLFIVWSLTGFWHGAEWTFLLWGIYYLVLLIFEKFVYGKYLEKLPSVLQWGYAFILVIISWVLFRSETIAYALFYLRVMFTPVFTSSSLAQSAAYLSSYWQFFLLGFIFSYPIYPKLRSYLEEIKGALSQKLVFIAGVTSICVIFLLSVIYMINSTYSPFIYFRF